MCQLENGQPIGEVLQDVVNIKLVKVDGILKSLCPCCDNFDDGHKACGTGRYCYKPAFKGPRCTDKVKAGKPTDS